MVFTEKWKLNAVVWNINNSLTMINMNVKWEPFTFGGSWTSFSVKVKIVQISVYRCRWSVSSKHNGKTSMLVCTKYSEFLLFILFIH